MAFTIIRKTCNQIQTVYSQPSNFNKTSSSVPVLSKSVAVPCSVPNQFVSKFIPTTTCPSVLFPVSVITNIKIEKDIMPKSSKIGWCLKNNDPYPNPESKAKNSKYMIFKDINRI